MLRQWPRSILVTVILAAAGCGGADRPAPAHSASFFPITGTGAAGTGADVLFWRYRVNGGQPITFGGIGVKFADEEVRITDGTTRTDAVTATISSTSASGDEAVTETDHLVPGPPPGIDTMDTDLRVTMSSGGMSASVVAAIMSMFSARPRTLPYARDDLDTLPVGYTETHDGITAAITTSTTTTTGGQTSPTMKTTDSATLSDTWTIEEQLPSFQVLGRDYANVVRIQLDQSATTASTGTPASATGSIWLAKGIGTVRSESTMSVLSTNVQLATELVDTNLTVP